MIKRPIVLKFGGSSVGSPDRFKKAQQIIGRHLADKNQVIVVASALSGVTNKLVALCDDSLDRSQRTAICDELSSRHILHAADILSLRSQRIFGVFLQKFLGDLEPLIYGPATGEPGSRNDTLLAMGERLSIYLFSLALEDMGVKSCARDAVGLVKTDNNFGEAVVSLGDTTSQIARWYNHEWNHEAWYKRGGKRAVPVISGFIGSTDDGRTTTLGRGGSDYSAALVAAAVNALRLERWTDVDGIYTDDPRLDDKALRYDEIVLEDALAWNRAGKLGMHRKALDPLVKAKIPVFVRSIDHPDWPGTVIRPKCHKLAATG